MAAPAAITREQKIVLIALKNVEAEMNAEQETEIKSMQREAERQRR